MCNLNQMKFIYWENLCEEFQAMHVKSYSVAIDIYSPYGYETVVHANIIQYGNHDTKLVLCM